MIIFILDVKKRKNEKELANEIRIEGNEKPTDEEDKAWKGLEEEEDEPELPSGLTGIEHMS